MYKLRLGKSVKGLIPDFSEQILQAKELGFDSIDVVLCECGYIGSNEQIEYLKSAIKYLKSLGLNPGSREVIISEGQLFYSSTYRVAPTVLVA